MFSSSDSGLDATYNYRRKVFERHVKLTPAGWVVTEFLPDVPWAGIYNTISCAASHHFNEGRWLCDTKYLVDYAKFWCSVGNPRLYSFPVADSILSFAKVTGDKSLAVALYRELERIHSEWDDHKCPDGLYWQYCGYDGMEYSISGDGKRPTINSYMYADKAALSVIAGFCGDAEGEKKYREQAEELRLLINEKLFNEKIGMYGTVGVDGDRRDVRELVGYIPYMYGIPQRGAEEFSYLLDENCFFAPYGPRTADRSHPEYNKHFDHECLWNGPSWPFATTQTLKSVIYLLQNYAEAPISDRDFMTLLGIYSNSQRDEDGSPYIDENLDPETGIWLARSILKSWNRSDSDRGRDYNHSSFIDLVITGVCGIVPSLDDTLAIKPLGRSLDYFTLSNINYHGRIFDLSWSKSDGLSLSENGKLISHQDPSDTGAMVVKL